MRLTARGRWLLVYLPAFLLLEAAIIVGATLLWGPSIWSA